MRAGGCSSWQLIKAILWPALGMMLLVLAAAEYAAPSLHRQAESMRYQQLHQASSAGQDIWAVDGHAFLNIGHMAYGWVPSDISIYQFDPEGRLLEYLHAEHAQVLPDGLWRLQEVKQGRLEAGVWQALWLPQYLWKPFVRLAGLEPQMASLNSLSLTDLSGYIEYLSANQINQPEVRLAFWSRIMQALLVPCMALFSVFVVFADPRSLRPGRYLLYGVVFAVVFVLSRQVLHSAGLLLGFPAWLIACSPLLLLAAAGVWLMRRFRLRRIAL